MVTLVKSAPATEIRNGARVSIGAPVPTPSTLDEVFANDPLGLLDGAPISQFEVVGYVEFGPNGLRFTDLNGQRFANDL